MAGKVRDDIHRVAAFCPAEYEPVMAFAFGGSDAPPILVTEYLALRREVKMAPAALEKSSDQCTTCGAHFRYGEVWRHAPTGEHVVLGHVCAEKNGLLAQFADFRDRLEEAKLETTRRLERELRASRRAAFLSGHDGLEAALGLDHRISKDLSEKLTRFGSLSEGQINLAHKLYAEAHAPPKPKRTTPAPQGRVEVEGVIKSTRVDEGPYGSQVKMLVESVTGFACWGTVPASLLELPGELRGAKVRFTATLEPKKDDPTFAFFKRPSYGVLA